MSHHEFTPAARVVALTLTLTVLHALNPGFALSQVSVGGSFTGGAVPSPILFPDGTAAAPSISFSSDSGNGFWFNASDQVRLSANGVLTMQWSPGTVSWPAAYVLGWHSGAISGTPDTQLQRDAAANLQLGADNASGAAVDQILSAADAITAADISGGDLTIQSGAGMGTGAVSALIFQTPTVAAAGANPQSLETRLTINSTSVAAAGLLSGATYGSATNCSSSAAPAVCSAAPAGSVVIAAAATTVTVNTTAVTANSQIIIQEDSSLGTKLSVTCNTTLGRTYAVTARTAATSFVITTSAAPVTNPSCLSYFIVN